MNCKRYEIGNGLSLVHIKTERFKSARLTLSLTLPLDRDKTPVRSMLMSTGFLGTERYPDFRSVCSRAEELYAVDVSDFNLMRGDLQILGLTATMLGEDYMTEEDRKNDFSILSGVFELFSEIVLRPLYRESDVETEKINRMNRIKARKNNAFGYAKLRFNKKMFEGEPSEQTLNGELGQLESICREDLVAGREELCRVSRAEFFYCGTEDAERIASLIKESFGACFEQASDTREQFVKRRADSVKEIEESGVYRQGNLLMGFRTGVVLDDPEFYAVELMNHIFGDGTSSKLFANVREKKSLCYFCASSYDEERGVIVVGAGIDNDDRTAAVEEILRQLDEIRRGNITDAELEAARESIENDCRAAEDHPSDYEDFARIERLFGGPRTIEEYRRGVLSVTREQIAEAARRITLDTVYFLKGTLADGEEDDYE
ncbi:MAG: insulinase family protein [Clostridia bacterium]|nr:insulinase family protein [Clostridia bacterium]